MDLRRFIKTFPDSYFQWGTLNAYPRIPLPYIEILDHVQAMTTPSVMHLINQAVRCMGAEEVYLEVGTWRGATLLGALVGNNARGIAIDNDTMDEHDGDERSSREVWAENMARFGMTSRTRYIDGSVPAVWGALEGIPPVGVYLFDGDKSTEEAAYEGLEGVIPFLSNQALILVDDANTVQIRRALHEFFRRHFRHSYPIIDMPTPTNCWGSFWNGVIGVAWGIGIEGGE